MIAQSFDLFGTADAPVKTNTKRTAHQAMLFTGELFAHVDPNRRPAEAPTLDPTLHDATIDEALPAAAADDRPEVIPAADLTDADIAHLAANSREVTDAEIAAGIAAAAEDDGFAFAGLTAAEVAATPAAAAAEPAPAPTRPAPAFTAATRRVAGAGEREFRYVGLVRRGLGETGSTGPIVAECGHEHTNRDWTTAAAGGSARDCARSIIAGAANEHTAEHTARRLRTAPVGLRSGAGFQHPAGTIEAARATAEANAASYLAAVAAVRALTA